MGHQCANLVHVLHPDDRELPLPGFPGSHQRAPDLGEDACPAVTFDTIGRSIAAPDRLVFAMLEDGKYSAILTPVNRLHAGAARHLEYVRRVERIASRQTRGNGRSITHKHLRSAEVDRFAIVLGEKYVLGGLRIAGELFQILLEIRGKFTMMAWRMPACGDPHNTARNQHACRRNKKARPPLLARVALLTGRAAPGRTGKAGIQGGFDPSPNTFRFLRIDEFFRDAGDAIEYDQFAGATSAAPDVLRHRQAEFI